MAKIGRITYVDSSLPALCLSYHSMMITFRTLTHASPTGHMLPDSHDWLFTHSRHCSGHMWVERIDTALISSSLVNKQVQHQIPDTRTCKAHSEGISPSFGDRRELWERMISRMTGCLWINLCENSLFFSLFGSQALPFPAHQPYQHFLNPCRLF